MLDMLLQTLWMRPYVAAFLLSFLIISVLNRGTARTFILLILGFVIAYLSEWSSIHWGFPYGDYLYIYSAMSGELVLGGVPLWDSISYVFLAYASYETVSYLGWKPKILLSALLMMLADVVIDPIAVRGDQWFLGKVFFYPEGGIYFGVPISNFAGWFVVGFAILQSYESITQKLLLKAPPLRAPHLGPYFYYGIMAFMAVVAIFIGAFQILAASLLIHAPILWALRRKAHKITRH